ncbi:MAG TPA: hypothetical protein VFV38_39080 [Ktedonobacteraceae bacterium]|nr:hypothetical protein [Ktedonobacteraceae bacterium]
MAGWQEELAELLRELGVTQEEPQTNSRSTGKSARGDARWRLRPGRSIKHLADTFLSEDVEFDDSESWLTDLDAMRREVDSIVRQVVQLMQRGDLEQSFKDDVMAVLRELRRRPAAMSQAASGDRAYLESVSAMLHFCRLVLLLSETALEDL